MLKTLVLDPGHGGKDRANRGTQGYVEADGVLKIAQYARDYLKPYPVKVLLTREVDKTLSLEERAAFARAARADLFISCHTNAIGRAGAVQTTASGTEAWISRYENGSRALADKIVVDVAAALGTKNRGVKTRESERNPGEDWYAVIRLLQTYNRGSGGAAVGIDPARSIPSIIVEFAFHDNPEEERRLLQEQNLKKAGEAMAAAVVRHYGLRATSSPAEIPAAPDSSVPVQPPAGTPSGSVSTETGESIPIMGEPKATAAQMDAYVRRVNPDAPKLAELYIALGRIEGVRGDVAFAQAIHETGFFRFGGQVKPDQNNYAGIGATNDGAAGASFPNPAVGVLAHLQHLKVYASKAGPVLPLADPRWNNVILTGGQGTAPTVDKLGGKWAVPGVGYGGFVARILKEILSIPDPGATDNEGLRQQVEALAAERDSLKQAVALLEAEKQELTRNNLALKADNERLSAVVAKIREVVGS